MQQPQHKRFSVAPVLLLGLIFAIIGASCGGGGGGGPAPNPNQDASGLYNGSGTVAFTLVQGGANLTLKDVKGIIHNNRFLFFNIDANANTATNQDENVLVDGTISSISKNDIVGTASIYRAGELVSNNVAVTGTVTTRSQISLTLAAATGTLATPLKTTGDFKGGSISGVFDTGYDQGASLAAVETLPVANEWGSNGINGVYHLYAPATTGGFGVDITTTPTSYSNTANGPNTCQYNGDVSIPNASINIYSMKTNFQVIGAGTCADLVGKVGYSGFAAAFTNPNAIDFLWYAETNGTYSVYGLFDRVNK